MNMNKYSKDIRTELFVHFLHCSLGVLARQTNSTANVSLVFNVTLQKDKHDTQFNIP